MMPFPIGAQDAIAHPGPPPAAAEAIVIGGGIIGVCRALFLAQAGISVVLLEKGRIGAEQSAETGAGSARRGATHRNC